MDGPLYAARAMRRANRRGQVEGRKWPQNARRIISGCLLISAETPVSTALAKYRTAAVAVPRSLRVSPAMGMKLEYAAKSASVNFGGFRDKLTENLTA
jgi:hypothetical protein